MTEFKDYYALLGISPQASEKEIKQAFRRLAHKFHPDKQEREGASLQGYYLAFSEAYQVLSDPGSRSMYDREFLVRGQFHRETPPDPGALLRELQEINLRMGAQHLQQIDMEGIRHFIGEFMAGPKAALLLRSADEAWINRCLDEILSILSILPDRFIPGLYAKMEVFMQVDEAFKSSLGRLLKKARRNLAIRRLSPYIVLLLTLLLCLGMYFYAKR